MNCVLVLLAMLADATMSEAPADTIARWRRDAVSFVRENFQVEPDGWQKQALRAFANESDPKCRRIALQACAGPGKSAVLAWCGWHFLGTQGDAQQHPNGYALSITGDNLRDNLWKEFSVWHGRSPYLLAAFEWSAEKIYAREYPATWWLKARSFSKTADPEAQGRTLSGLHSPYILYLPDESGDMSPSLLRTAEQGMSNCRWGKIVQAGNPTSLEGMLYHAVNTQSDKWTVIRITGDPDNPNRSSRIDIDWAREQIAEYGPDNPWVMAYVLGQFPPSSLNTLLGPDEVYAALSRVLNGSDYEHVQKRQGIDVARFGDDRTVMFPRQGLQAFEPDVMRNARSNEIAGRVMSNKAKWGTEVEFIDSTGGWASGVEDSVLLSGHALIPVNFSAKATDKRYFNLRSEVHFKAAEWVKRGAALPPGLTEIVKEACAARYWFEAGKFRVEEKVQIKKRLGKSPDLWEALLTTFVWEDMPASLQSTLPGYPLSRHVQGHANTDYDVNEASKDRSGVGRALT